LKNKKRTLSILLSIAILTLFSGCLYSIDSSILEKNEYDKALDDITRAESSPFYPDKELLKVVRATILERKEDYDGAYKIYQELSNSQYSIYCINRISIIEKFYLHKSKEKEKSVPIEKPAEKESPLTIYERSLREFLSDKDLLNFYNLFFEVIFFDFNGKNAESIDKLDIDSGNSSSSDSNLFYIEDKEGIYSYNPDENYKYKLNALKLSISKIRDNKTQINKINDLLEKSRNLLNTSTLSITTKSKINYYKFLLYLLQGDKPELASDALYASFYEGGLYYYQFLSYCIINTISKSDYLNEIFKINLEPVDLKEFFEISKDFQTVFESLKKDKKYLKSALKSTINNANFSSSTKKNLLDKHFFLSSYFFENNFYLEFSRSIFYFKDRALNKDIFNPFLVDYYLFTGEYDKAIYYQLDIISKSLKRLTRETKISSESLACIFPLWYKEVVEQKLGDGNFFANINKQSILYDKFLYLSLINSESNFNSSVVSTANAIGLMQLLPSTASWLMNCSFSEAKRQLIEPDFNIEAGFKYIDYLSKVFNGNIISIIGAYNGGHNGFAKKATKNVHPLVVSELYPVSETATYIKKTLRSYVIYKLLYEKVEPEDSFLLIIKNSP